MKVFIRHNRLDNEYEISSLAGSSEELDKFSTLDLMNAAVFSLWIPVEAPALF